ncbi:MAG: hypothetical protein SFZ02_08740 [bacterium]|nr:hypothetical protein [bacterium]
MRFFIVMSVGDADDILVIFGVTADFETSEAVIIAILNSVVYEPVGQ